MRRFAWCLMAIGAFAIGCNQPVETIPTVAPASSGTTMDDDHDGHEHAEGHDHDAGEAGGGAAESKEQEPSASTGTSEAIRFVADKRISVPGMMCPYSCWPTVKETLAGQPGVAAVQLAEQPAGTAEGEIAERVVELKLSGEFDADAAIAALAKVSFEAAVAN